MDGEKEKKKKFLKKKYRVKGDVLLISPARANKS
jgi:hypothetical protein